MVNSNKASISVRDLVEFIMRSGSIESGFAPISRANEGSRIHKEIQDDAGENYTKEVYTSIDIERDGIILKINGRIDGVIVEDKKIIINEIKTVMVDIDNVHEGFDERHWAQGKAYGYMYGIENNIENLSIRLTYYSIHSKTIKDFEKNYSIEELKDYFNSLVHEYFKWLNLSSESIRKRDESIASLPFPFIEYRKGQRELAISVYRSIKEGNSLFAEAPTGIGKTMGVIFPSLKLLQSGETSKIFYLTSKTTNRKVAEGTLQLIRESGGYVRSITLTAKDKVCFSKGSPCSSMECEYARGHFDRVNDALIDLFNYQDLNRGIIEEVANKHNVCPFELSLDASNSCDVIICDYNHVFDPTASLKRFFMEGNKDYTLLVDEAHNLLHRAREMYSAEINKKMFLEMKRSFKAISRAIYEIVDEINKEFIKIRKDLEGRGVNSSVDDKYDSLIMLINKFIKAWEENYFSIRRSIDKETMELILNSYFESVQFVKIYGIMKDGYKVLTNKYGSEINIKLMCIDPSEYIKATASKMQGIVFFSGTLSPMDYYIDVLGGDETSYRINIPYPFDKENLKVILDKGVSTRYKDREGSYDRVAKVIKNFISKKGNYLVFFPSYKYLMDVYEELIKMEMDDVELILQTSGMTDAEREDFLENFKEGKDKTLVGLAVMGGVFGEGIDLKGDRLNGVAIVGVGLPQVSFERNIIMEYYKEKLGQGFEYAYLYPGLNRVLQAGGRVIRDEDDKGTILLIDDRFIQNNYYRLLPNHYKPIKIIKSPDEIGAFIGD